MQRYFCDTKKDNTFTLSSNDSYHIKKVMRMHLNDLIEVVYEKILYICEIIDLNNDVIVNIKEKKFDNNEIVKKVILCQSLVNEQKMDLILQKCTELGVNSFYPYKSMNSVIKDNGKSDKKINRWQMIVKEASEQSKRNIIPTVNNFIDLNHLLKIEADLKLLCTVNEMTISIKKTLQENSKCDTIIVVIGPEGGFNSLEEKRMIENGFISVSLGNHVLRTETAGISVLSMINYEWMV